jgi:hypothetical protein
MGHCFRVVLFEAYFLRPQTSTCAHRLIQSFDCTIHSPVVVRTYTDVCRLFVALGRLLIQHHRDRAGNWR